MTRSREPSHLASRRTLLAAAGAGGLAAALAACGGSDDSGDSGGSGDSGREGGDTTEPEEGGGDGEFATTADVPEGGGAVFADEKVVVTQPVKGEFKAFSAVCTHQGCIVAEVDGGTINCSSPCGHGSKFAIADGSVENGPATAGLPAAKVTVKGGSLRLG